MDWLPIIAITLLLLGALFYGCCITAEYRALWELEDDLDEPLILPTTSIRRVK